MSNKQQTAVEWLVEQIKSRYDIDIERLSVTDKAKELEKQQHQETFKQSRLAEIFKKDMSPVWESWEHYYNETYNN